MKENRAIRFFSLTMAILMVLCSFPMVAFAEENDSVQLMEENVVSVEYLDNGKIRTTYEFQVTPEEIDENGIATCAVDSSFTMTGSYYRGADRKYSGNYISYQMTVTASDGTAVDKQVSIQLWDYNHAYSLQTDIVTANGITVMQPEIPITPNRTYYFKYYLATGSPSNLRIRMVIDTWS